MYFWWLFSAIECFLQFSRDASPGLSVQYFEHFPFAICTLFICHIPYVPVWCGIEEPLLYWEWICSVDKALDRYRYPH